MQRDREYNNECFIAEPPVFRLLEAIQERYLFIFPCAKTVTAREIDKNYHPSHEKRQRSVLWNVTREVTIKLVIKSFRHKGLKQLFETGERGGVTPALANRLRRQLDVLNRARATKDMNLPGYRLHQLKGNRTGTWSVTVNGNWRVTFKFEGEDAFDVDLEDYH